MSEFLSTLLDRALDRAPVLERRRPALFEPVPNVATQNSAGPLEEESVEIPETPRPRGRTIRVEANLPQRVEPIDTPASTHHDAIPPAPATRIDRGSSPLPPANPAPPAIAPPRPKERTAAKAIEPAPAATASREVAAAAVARPPADQSPREIVEVRNNNSGIVAAREDRRKSKPAAVEPPAPPPRAVAPPVVNTPLRPDSIVRAARITPAPEPPSAPTIHVTIGRIEVRATSTPAPAARATRAAGPKLNLEDYLRSRQ